MPRGMKPPPAIIRVESMSDGREIRPEGFVDDFTGERVVIPKDNRPPRRLVTPQEARDASNRAKLAGAKAVLVASGLGAPAAKVELVPKGMMVVGHMRTKDGRELAILRPRPAMRRV